MKDLLTEDVPSQSPTNRSKLETKAHSTSDELTTSARTEFKLVTDHTSSNNKDHYRSHPPIPQEKVSACTRGSQAEVRRRLLRFIIHHQCAEIIRLKATARSLCQKAIHS